jgi:hypothetical protein
MAEEKHVSEEAKKRMAEDKKKLETEREARAKAQAEHQKKMTGRPTPTQEEADLIKLGHHPELEPDGSTDPYAVPTTTETKHMEHAEGKPYQTRQQMPASGRGSTESKSS